MNTISTYSYRRKYRLASLDQLLRNALVAEKICQVDRSEGKYIDSPYGSQPTTVIQAICGTYATAAYTLTDDLLTVNEEFYVAEHIYDFEQVLSNFDVMASRMDEQNYSVAYAIDKYVLNRLCEAGTGAYTTPSGGFTTPANIPVILANLSSKFAGYADTYKGKYLVIEAADTVGFVQYMVSAGYNFADSALRNGWMMSLMGFDIHVVADDTFVDTTYAGSSVTVTNDGHRVAGVKGVTTYAAPRGIQYEEKSVSAKTGKEMVTFGYIGFAAWVPKRALTVDITITA